MNHHFKYLALTFGMTVLIASCSNNESQRAVSSATIDTIQITSYPEKIDPNCRGGKAKIYDECSDQAVLFEQARKRAKAEGKTVLVSYGAEWCIWCHVFDAYIHGDTNKFTYTYGQAGDDTRYTHTMRERAKRDVSQEAYDLKKYVSENFVIAHIDYEHSPDGDDVLSKAKAWEAYGGAVPYIFSVDANGIYAADFDDEKAELRRDTDDWYRGFDRVILLEELTTIRQAALSETSD